MLVAVQPFIDSSISKTVNVPADYPFEAFRGLYMQAWKAGLKGLATYRPNAVTGAVLSVERIPGSRRRARGRSAGQAVRQPAGGRARRPDLQGRVLDRGRQEVGLPDRQLRAGVRHRERPAGRDRAAGRVLRAGGPRDEGQHGSRRTCASVDGRAIGGSISKALANMREVVWDKGPVRCGSVTQEDGAQAPRFHDSEVAAIGYAAAAILARRGF